MKIIRNLSNGNSLTQRYVFIICFALFLIAGFLLNYFGIIHISAN